MYLLYLLAIRLWHLHQFSFEICCDRIEIALDLVGFIIGKFEEDRFYISSIRLDRWSWMVRFFSIWIIMNFFCISLIVFYEKLLAMGNIFDYYLVLIAFSSSLIDSRFIFAVFIISLFFNHNLWERMRLLINISIFDCRIIDLAYFLFHQASSY